MSRHFQKVGGTPPEPRLGLTATALLDGRVVIHGGVGADGSSTPDVYVLDASVPTQWSWSQPSLSSSSTPGPGRAWHTATLTSEGVIVFAYGLDSVTGETKDDINFLQTTDSLENWLWSNSNPLTVAGSVNPHILPASSQVTQPKVLAQSDTSFLNDTAPRPHNPKADMAGSLPGGNDPNGDEVSSDYSQVPTSATGATSPARQASDTQTSTLAQASSSDSVTSPFTGSDKENAGTSDATQGSSTKIIAGSVTAAFLLALGAGAVGLYMRHRNAKTAEEGQAMREADNGAPPVSHLLYTRQAPRRTLSLGSSIRSNREKSTASRRQGHRHQPSESFQPITEYEAREAVEEFGRLGQLSPQKPGFTLHEESDADAHRRTAVLVGLATRPDIRQAASSDSMHSQASVASYPFLGSVPLLVAADPASEDQPPRRQQSGNTRALLRSHSLSTTSSKSSHSRESDIGKTPLRVFNAPSTTPLPSREFEGPADIPQDPFSDSAEVRALRWKTWTMLTDESSAP